jgi:hypothetical protein
MRICQTFRSKWRFIKSAPRSPVPVAIVPSVVVVTVVPAVVGVVAKSWRRFRTIRVVVRLKSEHKLRN